MYLGKIELVFFQNAYTVKQTKLRILLHMQYTIAAGEVNKELPACIWY